MKLGLENMKQIAFDLSPCVLPQPMQTAQYIRLRLRNSFGPFFHPCIHKTS